MEFHHTLIRGFSPSTGLSATNLDSANFIASSSSYVLTVTDMNGQIVKDTFNMSVVQTPNPPVTILPEFNFLPR